MRSFDPIKEMEEEYRSKLSDQIRKTEGDIGLADRALSLQGAPGYSEFIKAVERKRDRARRDMELCQDSDSTLRMLQGRTQAYSAIASMLKETESLKNTLVKQLGDLKMAYESTVRPDGKVKPVTLGGLNG
jgi:hypothetical protein